MEQIEGDYCFYYKRELKDSNQLKINQDKPKVKWKNKAFEKHIELMKAVGIQMVRFERGMNKSGTSLQRYAFYSLKKHTEQNYAFPELITPIEFYFSYQQKVYSYSLFYYINQEAQLHKQILEFFIEDSHTLSKIYLINLSCEKG